MKWLLGAACQNVWLSNTGPAPLAPDLPAVHEPDIISAALVLWMPSLDHRTSSNVVLQSLWKLLNQCKRGQRRFKRCLQSDSSKSYIGCMTFYDFQGGTLQEIRDPFKACRLQTDHRHHHRRHPGGILSPGLVRSHKSHKATRPRIHGEGH